jgi:CBS domain-containing protein
VREDVIYVSPLLKRSLIDLDGEPVGPMDDVVIGPVNETDDGPVIRGFIANVQRRKIFVAASRIGWLDARGVQMTTRTVDLRQFRPRGDELLARSLIGTVVGSETVRDIGFCPSEHLVRSWVVATVALHRSGTLGLRGTSRVVDWREARAVFRQNPEPEAVRTIRAMHPSDAARALVHLSREDRVEVVGGLADGFLALVLEELPEHEQVELLGELALERAADVVEEMHPDDATDLLAELAVDRRDELLNEIEPARGARLKRLLKHDANTAGGLMTSDPIIVGPDTMVAEALARIRQPEVPSALAAQVFVTDAPRQTPTGPYLGSVTFQKLLREPPGSTIASCIEEKPGIKPVTPELPELAVAQRLAAYNLLALAVCDDAGRLLGAVTVDDVLDRALPTDWRER